MAVTMKGLLECGVHFGHQTRRWNPKMAEYIFAERNGIYIIDLQKTLRMLETAVDFVEEIASNGGGVLFVGTKRQSQEAVQGEAVRCGMYHVNHRWLGGMLTNFQTIRRSVNRLDELDANETNGIFDQMPKKEVMRLRREKGKLDSNLSGVREMKSSLTSLLLPTRGKSIRLSQKQTNSAFRLSLLLTPTAILIRLICRFRVTMTLSVRFVSSVLSYPMR